MGKPRARLQAPTPARAGGTPGFLGGKLIVERKAPSAPEHRNWRGSCSDLSPRRQQPRMDHPQVPLTSGETSATDQPAFRSGRVRTRGGPPGPRRAQAIAVTLATSAVPSPNTATISPLPEGSVVSEQVILGITRRACAE